MDRNERKLLNNKEWRKNAYIEEMNNELVI